MGGHLSHLKPEPHSTVLLASCGPVRGNTYRHGEKSVDGFLGIPYAEPPARFEKPVPAGIWTETRDCTEYGPRCPSSGMFHEKIDYPVQDVPDEKGCLTLSVFRPKWQSKSYIKRPVMVFIHGGGYELCSSRDNCAYSLSGTLPLKDVVVVTINYRLGILGFMTTGNKVCQGNYGLWDQTLALKWVKKHISSFGGNPENVTIFGQSAGGASVDLLSLSPHSRDLFHRVIPMSGCADAIFAIRSSVNEAKVSMEFARHKGFQGEGSLEVVEFLKSLPADKISEKTGFKHSLSGVISFCPNFDGDFFPKPLAELRKEAPRKAVMIGCVEHEGLLFAFADSTFTTADEMLKKRIAMETGEDMVNSSEKVRNAVYEYYSTKNDSSMERRLIEYVGDSLFNVGVQMTAENCAKRGDDVYFYVFDFCNPEGFGPIGDILPWRDPTHCTDLRYLLGEGVYGKFDPNENELQMMEKMTTWFSNFAKYLTPNSPGETLWEKYDGSCRGRHFHIGFPNSDMRDEYHHGRCDFLEGIQKKNRSYSAVFNGEH